MAKTRIVAGIERVVYDSMEEFKGAYPDGLVNLDWRNGQEGEWVLADDGSIMEVLKRGGIKPKDNSSPKGYIRTPSGSFVIWHKTQLDSNFRDDIYSFGENKHKRTKMSNRDRAFVFFVCLGRDPTELYLQLYHTKKRSHARVKAYELLRSELVMNAIKENIKAAGDETGATLKWAMKTIKKNRRQE